MKGKPLTCEESATSAEAGFEFQIEGTARMLAGSARDVYQDVRTLSANINAGKRGRDTYKDADKLLKQINRLNWEANRLHALICVRDLYDTSQLKQTESVLRRLRTNPKAQRT